MIYSEYSKPGNAWQQNKTIGSQDEQNICNPALFQIK